MLAQTKLPFLLSNPEFVFPENESLPADFSEYDIWCLNDSSSIINLGKKNDILECYRNSTYPEKTAHTAFGICYKKNHFCFPVIKKKYHYSKTNSGTFWYFLDENNCNENLINEYSQNIYIIDGAYSKEKHIIEKNPYIEFRPVKKQEEAPENNGAEKLSETETAKQNAVLLIDEITGTAGAGIKTLSTLADCFTKTEHNGFYFDEALKIVFPVKIFYKRVYDRYVTGDIQKIENPDQIVQQLYSNFSGFDFKNGNCENYYILYKALGTKDKSKFIAKKAGFYNGKIFDAKDLMHKTTEKSESDYYTQKTETPVYEIQGKKPEISELTGLSKYNELISNIQKADIPIEVREFLKLSATRHIKFNYSLIAEYYAHVSKEIQELMEASGLVIIDYNKAIENGFVTLKENLEELGSETEQTQDSDL